MSISKSFKKLKSGIIEKDWSAVVEAYNDMADDDEQIDLDTLDNTDDLDIDPKIAQYLEKLVNAKVGNKSTPKKAKTQNNEEDDDLIEPPAKKTTVKKKVTGKVKILGQEFLDPKEQKLCAKVSKLANKEKRAAYQPDIIKCSKCGRNFDGNKEIVRNLATGENISGDLCSNCYLATKPS